MSCCNKVIKKQGKFVHEKAFFRNSDRFSLKNGWKKLEKPFLNIFMRQSCPVAINLDNKAKFSYPVSHSFRLMQASKYWTAAEAVTQSAIFA